MTLAEKMALWAEKKQGLELLEYEIKEEVLTLEKTQVVGKCRATFAKGRTSFNYQKSVNAHISENGIPDGVKQADYKKPDVYDWKKYSEAVKVPQETLLLHAKTGKPSVSIKWD